VGTRALVGSIEGKEFFRGRGVTAEVVNVGNGEVVFCSQGGASNG
jgi:hypothetical protein